MENFKNSTVYQIYIKSFCDSNGDGIGDLNGIRSKLKYIKSLGVDYIWVTPFFCSPMVDNGYDVSDYKNVNPMFGTMADCEAMIAEADELGLGFMFDMVFNHTSSQHEWFKKALSGDKKYQDYYIFREGRENNSKPPADWTASFGGPAWDYVPELGKWYLHLFAPEQPDLNWENPEVREELKNVIRFWKEKGVKGFRFDVLNLISKPENLYAPAGNGTSFCKDGRHVHEFIRELVTDSGIENFVTVGEMAGTTLDSCIKYTQPQNHEMSMCFSFHHLKIDYRDGSKWALMPPDLKKLQSLFKEWQEEMAKHGGWNAVFWCNHDQPRIVSRLGDEKEYWKKSAKMLGTFIHMLRGTPYIYQGEEIGMTNAHFSSIEQYDDVEAINYYWILRKAGTSEEDALNILAQRARDNSRTPMQWNSEKYAGFSTAKPWLEVQSNYKSINVEAEQDDPDSILSYYKKLVQLRKEYRVISEGEIKFLETGNQKVIAYERSWNDDKISVLCNFSSNEEKISYIRPAGKVLIRNYEHPRTSTGIIRPFETLCIIHN